MYYKKLDIPSLPEDLRKDLIEEAIKVFVNEKQDPYLYHRRYETENENTLNFIKGESQEFYDRSGGVTAMGMNPELESRVREFYNKVDHPITNVLEYFGFLYVEGGPYCAPHIDDVERRRNGFQLLLKSGGDNVTTNWWEPKEEFKDLPIVDYCGIPYSRLVLGEEACLEENYWYWMKFDSIHSVENLNSIRIFLAGGVPNRGDYKDLLGD